MSKSKHEKRKPVRRAPARSTVLAHLDAVMDRAESLHDTGRLDEAVELLETNVARLGQFAPLRAGLAILYGEVGRYRDAAVEARLAMEMDPQQPDYYLIAALAYVAAGYYTFAHRARQQWLRFSPQDPMVAEMRLFDDEHRHGSELLRDRYHLRDASVAEEAGYLLDEGRWALDGNRWAEALRYSQQAARLAPGWPPPRNNASSALYYMRRYDEAIANAETVLRECDPDNLHSLANLVRYYVTTGDFTRAHQCADRLAALPLPEDPTEVMKQIEGLSCLDRDADIGRLAAGAHKYIRDLPHEVYVHWGIALANSGRRREALKYLRRAQEAGDKSSLLETTLEAIERSQPGPGIADRFPQTHFSDLMGREALDEIAKLVERGEKAGQPDKRAWADLLKRNPQLPLVARRMLYEAPDSAPAMIHILSSLPAPAAIEALREFASGRKGEQGDRMQALLALQQAGVLPPDARVEMWLDGKRRLIQPITQEISDEFLPDYPEKARILYNEALTAHREGRIADAERLYEAMLKIALNAKEAYNNLAGIYAQRGEEQRANTYLDRALEIDPLYVFPRGSRALQALQRDDIEKAKAWLEPLHTVRQWHPVGFAYYQKVMARIAIAESEYELARRHLELASQFCEDPEIDELLKSVNMVAELGGFGDWWRGMADRYRSRRQKAGLPPDPTLADCFGLLTKGDMTGIRSTLDLQGVSALKKAEIKAFLMQCVSDADFLARVVGDLNDADRAALTDLLDHGGVIDWQEFSRAHGDDLEESPYLEYHAGEMKTVMGRLRARGLLFEGTANGKLILAIPRELRPMLQTILQGEKGQHKRGNP